MARLGTYTDSTAPMITGPQLSFLQSLTADLFTLTEQITGEAYPNRDAALATLETLTKRQASARITELKSEILPVMRQTARYSAKAVEAPVSDRPTTPELDTNALYILPDGTIVRLKVSGAGRTYALTLDTESRKWVYAPGIVRNVKAEHVMTAEQAKDFGDTYAWCVRCSADLTDPVSVARGYGPVCAKYFA
jgi:hypothetical protein